MIGPSAHTAPPVNPSSKAHTPFTHVYVYADWIFGLQVSPISIGHARLSMLTLMLSVLVIHIVKAGWFRTCYYE